jgi:hypothetical protein
MISVELKGGLEAGIKLMDNVKIYRFGGKSRRRRIAYSASGVDDARHNEQRKCANKQKITTVWCVSLLVSKMSTS